LINNIQFLRAFSVLIVFFYHSNLNFFDKGFIGVDIFFVISGYVISSKIFNDLEKNKKFNIFNFYINRVKRIVPNIFVIFSIVLVFIIFFQPLDLLTKNLKVFLLSLIGLSNLYYLNFEGGYFDTIFSDPLNHSWSLGVEMQFYLFFPIIFLAINKVKMNLNKFIFTFLTLIIFGVYLNLYFHSFTQIIFYNPLFRIWEFLMGSVTFMIKKNYRYENSTVSNFSFLFLILLLSIELSINKIYYLFIILFLSCSFLYFYKNNYFSKFIFENKFFINLGNISYSFYLWHLPIIYFFDMYFLKNVITLPLIFVITFFLSQFTYRYVEQVYRYKKLNLNLSKKKLIFILIISIVFSGILSNLITKKNLISLIKNKIYKLNYLEINKNFVERTIQYTFEINGTKVYSECISTLKTKILSPENLYVNCQKNPEKKNRIFFVHGDSLTANFVPMLDDLDLRDSLYFEHYDVAILDLNINKLNNLRNYYDEIVFVTNVESKYTLDILLEAKKSFNEEIKILILGSPPHIDLKISPLKCFIQNRSCEYNRNQDINSRNLIELNTSIKNIVKNNKEFYFFDPYSSICPQENCYVYDSKKDLLTHRDDNHLTFEGSMMISRDFQNFYDKNFK